MQMDRSDIKVAVIGSGATGLTAIKCCLDEGLQPTCFEKSDDIGGTWVYRENKVDNQKGASVFRSTVTNTSKEAMCFSDFPFPKDWPNFLHNTYVKKYLDMYAERFGLKKHILFATSVTRLEQAPDYHDTGRWIVTFKHDEVETRKEFDAVMICTGMFHNPIVPDFPGLNEFQGKVIHTYGYRRPEGFEGKRVVVVGIGNSAGDAAADASRYASKVFLSVRRGTWLTSRLEDNGMPYDLMDIRRYHRMSSQMYLSSLKASLERRYGFVGASIKPAHDILASEVMVNEEVPGCILNGSVIIKANIAKFTKTGVVFEDGTREDDIDAVIMATGYRFGFPFQVDCPSLMTKEDGRVPLYKLLFPLGLKHSTLSVSGAFEPFSAVNPLVELQARWAARVFKGLAVLPSQSEMEAEVKTSTDIRKKMFIGSHTYVDPISYGDLLACEIGVKPNFLKLFFTDPGLTLRCLFGPFSPYQYRLVGPGKWDGAREAINTMWERIVEPTQTRFVETKSNETSQFLTFFVIVSIIIVASACLSKV